MYLSACLHVCLSVSVCLSICLSVCQLDDSAVQSLLSPFSLPELVDIFPTPGGIRHTRYYDDAASRNLSENVLAAPSAALVESLTEHLCQTVTHEVCVIVLRFLY